MVEGHSFNPAFVVIEGVQIRKYHCFFPLVVCPLLTTDWKTYFIQKYSGIETWQAREQLFMYSHTEQSHALQLLNKVYLL